MAPGGLFSTAAVAVIVSLAVHVALNSPIQPVPSPPPPAARYTPNNLLQGLEKLGEGLLREPEDVYVDAADGGTVYTATRDGWLQRMRLNGSWEQWRFVGGTGLLGIAPSADGGMLVCDADKGLLKVEEGRVTILASTVEGSTIRFADAAIEASDGTVYFSDASTRFPFDRWFLSYLEARRTGRLLKYDPRTGKTSVALDNLAFANGVALPRDETFVIVCESAGYRCLKLWLKGDKTGQTETFVDLPGSPDNIRRAPDGSFWIALLQLRSPWIDLVSRWTFTKRVVAAFPPLLDRIKATAKGAMVAHVSEGGEIIRLLDDSEGKVINFITSVTEFDGDLYLGSLATNFVGRLSLAKLPEVNEAVPS
ncbi:hypothetical protein QYE76_039739 [Lolium multiflorum]|uniref:Strictosidine synthase conserved region domain-containing protein n=1 Tax=Lolium multiflorum TaxID=4521 RepID=A0AAD8TAF1_LOLMU|nr:hypothetical protein QYE76_039739 [Lolium multiflorum]